MQDDIYRLILLFLRIRIDAEKVVSTVGVQGYTYSVVIPAGGIRKTEAYARRGRSHN
jgi:hypothetical protein